VALSSGSFYVGEIFLGVALKKDEASLFTIRMAGEKNRTSKFGNPLRETLQNFFQS